MKMSYIYKIKIFQKHANYFHENVKKDFDNEINPVIIISVLIHQYLQLKCLGRKDSIKSIIDSYQGEIGLTGPGNGIITCCLEA